MPWPRRPPMPHWSLLRWSLCLQTSKRTKTSKPSSSYSACGENIVSLGGESNSAGECGEELLGSEEELEDAALHHRLSLVHRRALSHYLASSKTKGCQWVLQQLEVKQLLRSDTEAAE